MYQPCAVYRLLSPTSGGLAHGGGLGGGLVGLGGGGQVGDGAVVGGGLGAGGLVLGLAGREVLGVQEPGQQLLRGPDVHPAATDQSTGHALLGIALRLAEQHQTPALDHGHLLVRHAQDRTALVATGGLVLGLGGFELGLELGGVGVLVGLLDGLLETVGLVTAPGHLAPQLVEATVGLGHGVGQFDQGGGRHLRGERPLDELLADLRALGRGHAADAQEPRCHFHLTHGHLADGGTLGAGATAVLGATAGVLGGTVHGKSSFRWMLSRFVMHYLPRSCP